MAQGKYSRMIERAMEMRRLAAEARSHEVPAKKHTKKASKASVNSFDKTLKGIPGGGRRGFNYVTAIAAEETGCKVASEQQERRLVHSARNCHTTKGNYVETKEQ